MPTNILSLPLITATVITGTNEDWLDGFAFTDNAVPVSIAGIAFTMHVRRNAEDHEAVIAASTAAGTLTNGGADGKLTIGMGKDAMSDVPAGTYVFDIVAAADGHQRVAVRGDLEVFRGVTR